jgi:hypothetical protein
MMVDHHHVEAELARLRNWLVAGGAAVDGDEERRAARGQRPHRLHVGAVALEQAIRNVDDRLAPAMTQVARERRRRGRAVDVVVAEDGDGFPADDRVGKPRRRCRHVRQHIGIRHQCPYRRIEKGRDLVDLDATPGEDARQQLGHVVVALRDRERTRRTALVEPVTPGAPAHRALDAEEEAPRRAWRYGQCDGHGTPGANHFQRILRYWMKPGRSASLS